jgi:NAD(P)H-nitrite reductase large subunit
MRHLIIGNGMAGVTAAGALARLDPRAQITIISDEETPFYSRPGLMYYMMGTLKEWDLHIARDGFYRRLGAELKYGVAARTADDGDAVELASGERIPFDRLLIATGSKSRRPHIPGGSLDGTHFMYTLRDCKHIMSRSRKGMRAVIVGGGLLGAELAEVWRHFGLHVVQLVREPWYFQKGLSEPQGRIVEQAMRRHGVELYLDEEAAELRGNGALSSVLTKNGKEFGADVAGITIGVEPNIDLAKASGVETGRGVLVDEGLRTSRPRIFAAGDCAEIRGAGDRAYIEQLWYSAARQGEAAARCMMGDPRLYDSGTFYNSAMFFHVDYVAIGAVRAPGDDLEEETVVSRDGRAARRFIHRDGLVVGITSVGANDPAALLMQIVREGANLDHVKRRLKGWRWPKA